MASNLAPILKSLRVVELDLGAVQPGCDPVLDGIGDIFEVKITFHVNIGFSAIVSAKHEFICHLKRQAKKSLGAPVIQVVEFYLAITGRGLVNRNFLVKDGIYGRNTGSQ